MVALNLQTPQWHAPSGVCALYTTRQGGVSLPPYDSLNLATHVGDDVLHVTENRARLRQIAHLPNEPIWLNQTHSTAVYPITDHMPETAPHADACYTQSRGQVCAILTADCL